MRAEQPSATKGEWVDCPVSGVPFQIADHQAKITYQGHVYRACCSGCAKKLGEDPSRFLELACR